MYVCVYESTHGYNVQMGYVYMARPSVDERLCVIISAMIPTCTTPIDFHDFHAKVLIHTQDVVRQSP